MNRKSYVAGSFYPSRREECVSALEKYCSPRGENVSYSGLVAGIVPHAGWMYSGATAGKVYSALQANGQIDTFVLFGAVHSWGVDKAALWQEGKWETPLGEIVIDEELTSSLLALHLPSLEANPHAHAGEHSLEVQIPFIQHLFPQAKIVPILVPPFSGAIHLGEAVAKILPTGKKVVALGSTDMTHYGARFGLTQGGAGPQAVTWVKQRDHHMLDLILGLQAEEVIPEARKNQTACGSGAITATLAFARALHKKEGHLLAYTTSLDAFPKDKADTFVAYAGVVF